MAEDQLQRLAMRLPDMPQRLLAGVSGGADSVALLRLLLARGARVQAVHVNHGLRGESSDGDEAFVRTLCEKLSVPLWVYRAEPPEAPGEDWARRVRYDFFRKAMSESGCEALALAHHRDDQAETVLLHLLRGAGLTGLSGMARDRTLKGMRIVRPLLGFERRELREALESCGQGWREDESNADCRYLRNAVRHELLPLMERLAPGAAGRVAGAAELLRSEEEGLQDAADAFLRSHGGDNWLYLTPLTRQAPAMQARIVRTWWQNAAGGHMNERTLSRDQTEALLKLVGLGAGSRCNLPGGWHGVSGWTCLHLVREQTSRDVSAVPVTLSRTQLGGVTLTVEQSRGTPGDGRMEQELPRELLQGCELRFRRPGDWLKPFGSGKTQSLQDFLVNRRIDAPFRDRVPLLCRSSEVLLAGGVGAGDIPKLNCTEDNVRVIWSGEMPWMRGE